jgi:cell division protein FtsA
VEPILEDIFATVADQIQQAGNERKVAAGVVLTGGVSRMPFICDLAHTVLGIPARLGEVSNVAGEDREDLFGGVTTVVSDPAFATCLGMLLNMHKEGMQPLFETQSDKPRIWRRVKDWLKESFA